LTPDLLLGAEACLRVAASAKAGASVYKRQSSGGLSASGEIRRSINIRGMDDLATAYAFIHGQSPWSSA